LLPVQFAAPVVVNTIHQHKLLVRKQRFVEAIDRSTATLAGVTRFAKQSVKELGEHSVSEA
jgi:hypothetical protein